MSPGEPSRFFSIGLKPRNRKQVRVAEGQSPVVIPEWVNWDIWRVVDAGMGTLVEVSERWTLRGLIEAHQVLDLKADAERKARERQ